GQVINSDVLRYAVVNGTDWQDVFFRIKESKEPELQPQLAFKTLVKRNLREPLAHLVSSIREGYIPCCQNLPIAQEFVHGRILRHKIHGADRYFPIADAALSASAEIALHENAVCGIG